MVGWISLIFFAAAILLIIIAGALNKTGKITIEGTRRRRFNILIASLTIIGFILYYYDNTENLTDLLIILGISLLSLALFFGFDKLRSLGKIHLLVDFILTTFVGYFFIYYVNMFSIDAISYMFVIILIVLKITSTMTTSKGKGTAALMVYGIVSLLLVLSLNSLFGITFDGMSKPMHQVKKYIITELETVPSDIKEIVQLTSYDDTESLMVRFEGDRDMFMFYYKDGKVTLDERTKKRFRLKID